MKKEHNPEKILILIALALFAGIIFYNAFYVPQVSVPTIIYVDKEPSESSGSQISDNSSSSSSTNNSSKININTATAPQLAETLPGIGDALAQRILEYRQSNGNFSTIEEIKNVSGIGDKMFENIKDLICV